MPMRFRRKDHGGLICLLVGLALAARGADSAEPIDWARARELREKSTQGVTLTDEERAYLDRAIVERRNGNGGGIAQVLAKLSPEEQTQVRALMQKRRAGEPLTDEDRALEQKVRGMLAGTAATRRPDGGGAAARERTGLVPLTEMTAKDDYHGRDGGLYGGGKNEPPPAHLKAALAAAARVGPLDRDGKPSEAGKIALLSVGMSNTTQEFSRFQEFADRDAAKAGNVVLVDGAQGGQAAAQWAAGPDTRIWQTVDERLKAAGVGSLQVQVVWLKQAEIKPTEPFPGDADQLEADLATIVRMLKRKFANLRLVYLSSRIYAGYATTTLNPEPYAYDSAFAVRGLIQRQVSGDPALNFDPARGAVNAPVLLWGPYLWADGLTPRKADGLVWRREDLREDGTHPSATSGRDKVAQQLLAFLKSDATAKSWFVKK